MSRVERFGLWTLVATALLAVATFGLALATADMARSTRKLAGFAKQQAHDTQDALAVARRQATAAEMANQIASSPEISVSAINIAAPVAKTKMTASFTIIDIGRLPASSVQGQAKLIVLPPPQLPPDLTECTNCERALLFPVQGFQGNGLIFPTDISSDLATEQTVNDIKNGTMDLYLMGRVDYIDGANQRHKILLCNVYKASENTTGPCATGNSAE